MTDILNENQLTIMKGYEFKKPFSHKIDSNFDNCIRDCHNKSYHTFEYKCVYDIKLTNLGNIEIVNSTFADKRTNLYELNRKLNIARQKKFSFHSNK